MVVIGRRRDNSVILIACINKKGSIFATLFWKSLLFACPYPLINYTIKTGIFPSFYVIKREKYFKGDLLFFHLNKQCFFP